MILGEEKIRDKMNIIKKTQRRVGLLLLKRERKQKENTF